MLNIITTHPLTLLWSQNMKPRAWELDDRSRIFGTNSSFSSSLLSYKIDTTFSLLKRHHGWNLAIQPFKFFLSQFFHLLDSVWPPRASRARNLPPRYSVRHPQILQSLLLNQTIFLGICFIEAKGFLERHRRICNDAHLPQQILGSRMKHQWVQEEYIPNLSGCFVETFVASFRLVPCQFLPELSPFMTRMCWIMQRSHPRRCAFGMFILSSRSETEWQISKYR